MLDQPYIFINAIFDIRVTDLVTYTVYTHFFLIRTLPSPPQLGHFLYPELPPVFFLLVLVILTFCAIFYIAAAYYIDFAS